MRESLKERCDAQIRNEAAMRKVALVEYEHVLKLCAMLYVDTGREVDGEHIKECKQILKDKAGIFSNFRGTLQRVVQVKMSLADDPNAYIDDVIATYQKLKSGIKLPGEMIAMAATTIVENCPADQREEITEKTRETYAKIKANHPFLTDESDMALIALMIMAGKDPEQAAVEAETLFQAMKQDYKISSDVAQSAAMVLALSDKPTGQKLENFFSLYNACKDAKRATSRDKAMVIYAAFADLDYDQAEVVSMIGEVDDCLKGQKGYNPFSFGAAERRLFAASMVLEDMQANSAAVTTSVTGAVTQTIVEQLVLILVMLIVTSIIISSAAANSF